MINTIQSGIPGFDQLTVSELAEGGIPEKSTTLIYGPPKTGKSIFCNQFTYNGLSNQVPCLYVSIDQGFKKVQRDMMDFQWLIQNYIQNQTIYFIDGISHLSGVKLENKNNIIFSSVSNPADLMVKVGIETRNVYKTSNQFRSILDSLNTLFAFNPDQMVIRILKAYLRRISEAGGTGLISYTEGITDPKTEKELKSLFNNTIRLDGQYMHIKSDHEEFDEVQYFESDYKITDTGIIVNENNFKNIN
jgi:KaiC/GvpD/RAD55 family RecA-like ATPase